MSYERETKIWFSKANFVFVDFIDDNKERNRLQKVKTKIKAIERQDSRQMNRQMRTTREKFRTQG